MAHDPTTTGPEQTAPPAEGKPPGAFEMMAEDRLTAGVRITEEGEVLECAVIVPLEKGRPPLGRILRVPRQLLGARTVENLGEDVRRNIEDSLHRMLAEAARAHITTLLSMTLYHPHKSLMERGAGNRFIEAQLKEHEALLRDFYKIPKRGKPSPWNAHELEMAVKIAAEQVNGRVTAEKVRRRLAVIEPKRTPPTAKAFLLLVSRQGLKWEDLIKRQQ